MKDQYGYYCRRDVLCKDEEDMNQMFEQIKNMFETKYDHMRWALIETVIHEFEDGYLCTIGMYIPKIVLEDIKNAFHMKTSKKGNLYRD